MLLSDRQFLKSVYMHYYGPVMTALRVKNHKYLQLKTTQDYLYFMDKCIVQSESLMQYVKDEWVDAQMVSLHSLHKNAFKDWLEAINSLFEIKEVNPWPELDDNFMFPVRNVDGWASYYEYKFEYYHELCEMNVSSYNVLSETNKEYAECMAIYYKQCLYGTPQNFREEDDDEEEEEESKALELDQFLDQNYGFYHDVIRRYSFLSLLELYNSNKPLNNNPEASFSSFIAKFVAEYGSVYNPQLLQWYVERLDKLSWRARSSLYDIMLQEDYISGSLCFDLWLQEIKNGTSGLDDLNSVFSRTIARQYDKYRLGNAFKRVLRCVPFEKIQQEVLPLFTLEIDRGRSRFLVLLLLFYNQLSVSGNYFDQLLKQALEHGNAKDTSILIEGFFNVMQSDTPITSIVFDQCVNDLKVAREHFVNLSFLKPYVSATKQSDLIKAGFENLISSYPLEYLIGIVSSAIETFDGDVGWLFECCLNKLSSFYLVSVEHSRRVSSYHYSSSERYMDQKTEMMLTILQFLYEHVFTMDQVRAYCMQFDSSVVQKFPPEVLAKLISGIQDEAADYEADISVITLKLFGQSSNVTRKNYASYGLSMKRTIELVEQLSNYYCLSESLVDLVLEKAMSNMPNRGYNEYVQQLLSIDNVIFDKDANKFVRSVAFLKHKGRKLSKLSECLASLITAYGCLSDVFVGLKKAFMDVLKLEFQYGKFVHFFEDINITVAKDPVFLQWTMLAWIKAIKRGIYPFVSGFDKLIESAYKFAQELNEQDAYQFGVSFAKAYDLTVGYLSEYDMDMYKYKDAFVNLLRAVKKLNHHRDREMDDANQQNKKQCCN
ncbi:hypothetical protein MP228_009540 [Amoeboaphelidium protococcarum]|nr:hypothetical protein MP228_009540 [Amoeboaphelidium protococcarum]